MIENLAQFKKSNGKLNDNWKISRGTSGKQKQKNCYDLTA